MTLSALRTLMTQGLRGFARRFSKTTNVLVGFALVMAGLLAASWMPLSLLAACIASISAIAGTVIWYPALMDMSTPAESKGVEARQVQAAVAAARLQWEAEEKDRVIDDLRGRARSQLVENENLQREIAELRATQMAASSWKQDWEMVLLEVEHKITDWQERQLHEIEASTFSRGETHIYRGLLDKAFKAKLGFSLDRLRVHMPVGSSTLLVSVPDVSLVGISDIRTDWRHKHVEVSRAEGTVRGGERLLDGKHPSLAHAAEVQSAALEQRVNCGVDLAYLHEPVREMAKRILRSMLAPICRDVEFVQELHSPGVPLDQFLESQRMAAEERLGRLQARQQQALAAI